MKHAWASCEPTGRAPLASVPTVSVVSISVVTSMPSSVPRVPSMSTSFAPAVSAMAVVPPPDIAGRDRRQEKKKDADANDPEPCPMFTHHRWFLSAAFMRRVVSDCALFPVERFLVPGVTGPASLE